MCTQVRHPDESFTDQTLMGLDVFFWHLPAISLKHSRKTFYEPFDQVGHIWDVQFLRALKTSTVPLFYFKLVVPSLV